MKAIRLAGLAMVLSLGAVSLAGAQEPVARQGHKHGQFQGRQGRGFGVLLKGIQLTDKQKDQLKELRQKQGKGNKDQFQNVREQVKAAREKGDTVKLQQLRAQMGDQMKQRRERMIQDIRGILTNDQRQIFDRNVADAQQRFQQRASHREEEGRNFNRRGRADS